MITCCIRYTLDPHAIEAFEQYARTWPPIIARCGGRLIDYFLPKVGANNFALALIEVDSLAAYEDYRARLRADPQARENFAHAQRTRCILVEERDFLRRSYRFFARSTASRMSWCASARSPQRAIFTHLPSSRSL